MIYTDKCQNWRVNLKGVSGLKEGKEHFFSLKPNFGVTVRMENV